jgi:hypothetical protein
MTVEFITWKGISSSSVEQTHGRNTGGSDPRPCAEEPVVVKVPSELLSVVFSMYLSGARRRNTHSMLFVNGILRHGLTTVMV